MVGCVCVLESGGGGVGQEVAQSDAALPSSLLGFQGYLNVSIQVAEE